MSLNKATVLFAAAMLAVASAGLVHPKSQSSAALPETNVEQQALLIGESRDGKALGGFGSKDAALKDALLTRNIDPTLLSLEQNLINDYCNRDTVKAFKTVCKGLGQPAVYEICKDLSTDDQSGTLIFKGSSINKKCAFFISTPGYDIDIKCRISTTPSIDLANILIDMADDIGSNPVSISATSPTTTKKNAMRIIFENKEGANYECSWTTKAIA